MMQRDLVWLLLLGPCANINSASKRGNFGQNAANIHYHASLKLELDFSTNLLPGYEFTAAKARNTWPTLPICLCKIQIKMT